MLLLIDKPKGMTSHDVVNVVRKAVGKKKVGHAGTLDPNATGLLVVGVGRESTKKLGELTRNTTKKYSATIMLGEKRETDDIEGKIISKYQNTKTPSLEQVKKILKEFTGEINQTPPVYSAIKISGQRAYKIARSGRNITLKPRKVTVYLIKLVKYKYPILQIDCEVSSGTYIRALARDIGDQLGVGAYLQNLRRTAIGRYKISDAKSLEDIIHKEQ